MGAETLISVCFSFVLRSIGMIAVYMLFKNNFCFSKFLSEHKITAVLIYLYISYCIANSFIKIREVSDEIALPVSSSLLCTFFIIAICSYTSSLEIKSVGSVSVIIFTLSAIAFIIIPMTAFEKIRLSSVYFSENIDLIKKTTAIFSNMTEPLLILLYMPFRKEKELKHFSVFLFSFLVTDILLCLLCISILHRKSILFDFPFFAAANTAQPFEMQRADAFYSLIFVMLSVFRITCLTVPSSEILGIISVKMPFKVILTLSFSGILSFFIFRYEFLNSDIFKAIALIFFVFMLVSGNIYLKFKRSVST